MTQQTNNFLSDDLAFQTLCAKVFNGSHGEEFLKFFNSQMIYHPIIDVEQSFVHAAYQDGFFGLIREINKALVKYNKCQSTITEVANERKRNSRSKRSK